MPLNKRAGTGEKVKQAIVANQMRSVMAAEIAKLQAQIAKLGERIAALEDSKDRSDR